VPHPAPPRLPFILILILLGESCPPQNQAPTGRAPDRRGSRRGAKAASRLINGGRDRTQLVREMPRLYRSDSIKPAYSARFPACLTASAAASGSAACRRLQEPSCAASAVPNACPAARVLTRCSGALFSPRRDAGLIPASELKVSDPRRPAQQYSPTLDHACTARRGAARPADATASEMRQEHLDLLTLYGRDRSPQVQRKSRRSSAAGQALLVRNSHILLIFLFSMRFNYTCFPYANLSAFSGHRQVLTTLKVKQDRHRSGHHAAQRQTHVGHTESGAFSRQAGLWLTIILTEKTSNPRSHFPFGSQATHTSS